MHDPVTVFDIILPRVLAGVTVTAHDIAALGHGGYCRKCAVCVFPNCAFGSGVEVSINERS
jgi:hypothetical protein